MSMIDGLVSIGNVTIKIINWHYLEGNKDWKQRQDNVEMSFLVFHITQKRVDWENKQATSDSSDSEGSEYSFPCV